LLNKTGAGRLYYRIGLDYAPTNLNLKAADFGFSVTRTYESVDKKDDVSRDSNGTWHIKSGASVRAKLHFSAPGSRYHVALTDPLPAGAEPLNPDLVGSRNIADKKSQSAWWWQRWFDHQNLRDQQAEAFTALLNAGEYDYSYVMRATTPGDYHVPPTKVQEMYAPETFGRTASEHVTIE